MTDDNGEVHNLITEQAFPAGVYRVEFDTKSYWKSQGSTPFHEVADVSIKKCEKKYDPALSLCIFTMCLSGESP